MLQAIQKCNHCLVKPKNMNWWKIYTISLSPNSMIFDTNTIQLGNHHLQLSKLKLYAVFFTYECHITIIKTLYNYFILWKQRSSMCSLKISHLYLSSYLIHQILEEYCCPQHFTVTKLLWERTFKAYFTL